jgi:predicted XRE-type DNA-binding protein
MRTKTSNRIKAEKSSGNIFADLGLPHPERELLKAKLTLEIYRLIRKRNLTQAEAGRILGIKQPHVSALMRNRAGSFSVERLMDFLTALGQDVEISVKPARERRGEVYVVASENHQPVARNLPHLEDLRGKCDFP